LHLSTAHHRLRAAGEARQDRLAAPAGPAAGRAARARRAVPSPPDGPGEHGGAAMTPLRAAGRVVAEYHRGADLPPGVSPRPYLHPIRTPAGTVVTAVAPEDHPHHLGFSF